MLDYRDKTNFIIDCPHILYTVYYNLQDVFFDITQAFCTVNQLTLEKDPCALCLRLWKALRNVRFPKYRVSKQHWNSGAFCNNVNVHKYIKLHTQVNSKHATLKKLQVIDEGGHKNWRHQGMLAAQQVETHIHLKASDILNPGVKGPCFFYMAKDWKWNFTSSLERRREKRLLNFPVFGQQI